MVDRRFRLADCVQLWMETDAGHIFGRLEGRGLVFHAKRTVNCDRPLRRQGPALLAWAGDAPLAVEPAAAEDPVKN